MGRHSRKGPAPQGSEQGAQAAGAVRGGARPGTGRRRRAAAPPPEPHATHLRHPGHPDQAPAAGPQQPVRGGHPEQREPGGGWGGTGRYGDWRGAPAAPARPPGPSAGPAGPPGPAGPAGRNGRPASQGPATGLGAGARIPGPRREFVEAFDGSSQGAPPEPPAPPAPGEGDPADRPGGGKGRTVTGIAAAAVTTVLAVVVAGQVTGSGPDDSAARPPGEAAERGQAGGGTDARFDRSDRSDERAVPPPPARRAAPVTYAQLMAKPFPLDPKLNGPGEFEVVPGTDRAPGKGRKVRYRIDVEKGLGLDSGLFARAVQQTLNDDRSWAHGGAMTFERVSSGEAEFVVTLASPVTTGVWCAKSGLDTTVDNVSCDSAATERVMINAYRWAQGSATYGVGAMHPYRQMLINHEVGHRLGHNHVNCRTPGALAPVMQQQTKSLEVEGVKCRPNPWVFPNG
ncbi:DUF3152 domain-containing protein [Streptomyces lavendulocolor]|uniref:DUF3152 domain-containing protein n=1 Tax=Streptomyces lavendulocolor TaxID=67316 RepID=UPI003C2D4153